MGNRVVAGGLGNERDRSPGHNFNRDCIPDCLSHQLDGHTSNEVALRLHNLQLEEENSSDTKEGGRPKHFYRVAHLLWD